MAACAKLSGALIRSRPWGRSATGLHRRHSLAELKQQRARALVQSTPLGGQLQQVPAPLEKAADPATPQAPPPRRDSVAFGRPLARAARPKPPWRATRLKSSSDGRSMLFHLQDDASQFGAYRIVSGSPIFPSVHKGVTEHDHPCHRRHRPRRRPRRPPAGQSRRRCPRLRSQPGEGRPSQRGHCRSGRFPRYRRHAGGYGGCRHALSPQRRRGGRADPGDASPRPGA